MNAETQVIRMEQTLQESLSNALQQLDRLLLGKTQELRLVMSCLLADGHLLLEDLPGTGKTLLAQGLARVTGLEMQRVQGTNDLLPGDLIGSQVFSRKEEDFRFIPGPIFSELLLVDEINRMPPKSQSALLQAMEERQVSVDGVTRSLPMPFWVVATQNPHGQIGTFPLPEAQLDRFLMRLSLGYPDRQAETEILLGQERRTRLERLTATLSPEALLRLREAVDRVTVSEALVRYVLDLVHQTRNGGRFEVGLSTRAAQSLIRAARAWALLRGDDKVIPMDVQSVFIPVVLHRLAGMASTESVQDRLHELLEHVEIP
ncbi:MAG: MoxR family ATPase [Candidatus Thiodiazotropha sp.]|jgi:MoxR-like ATPase